MSAIWPTRLDPGIERTIRIRNRFILAFGHPQSVLRIITTVFVFLFFYVDVEGVTCDLLQQTTLPQPTFHSVQRSFCSLQVDNCSQVMWHESQPCDQWRSEKWTEGEKKAQPHSYLPLMKRRREEVPMCGCALQSCSAVTWLRQPTQTFVALSVFRQGEGGSDPARWRGVVQPAACLPSRCDHLQTAPTLVCNVRKVIYSNIFFLYLWGGNSTWTCHMTWLKVSSEGFFSNAWAIIGLSFFPVVWAGFSDSSSDWWCD